MTEPKIEAARPDPRLAKIVANLLIRTRMGSITWEHLRRGPRGMQALEFSYSTSSASIVVASSAMGQDPYTLQIYNGDGIIIEQLEVSARSRMVQESAKEIPKTVIFKSPLFDEIRELHGLAYRQALNVDQMLDTIVQELEQGE